MSTTLPTLPPTSKKPVRCPCPFGGFAPCVDDLCSGDAVTLCELEHGWDFCEHGYVPETCDFCDSEDNDWDDGDSEAYDSVSEPEMIGRLRHSDAQPDFKPDVVD